MEQEVLEEVELEPLIQVQDVLQQEQQTLVVVAVAVETLLLIVVSQVVQELS